MSDTLSPDRPLTIDQAAEFLNLKKSYIYKLICLGKIPCYKPTGGRVFFKQNELESFIFRGKQSADYEVKNQVDLVLAGGKQ
jgi:excisionase family DNA binding protein